MRFALCALLLATFACAGSAFVPNKWVTTFNEVEYAPFGQSGTGSISGQAFLKSRGGDVKVGAGNVVYLYPATAFTEERIRALETPGYWEPDTEQARAQAFTRSAQADADGRFAFKDLPAGRYIVACRIQWYTGAGPTGAIARATVDLADGQTIQGLIVTR